MGKEKIIPIFAMILILTGTISTLYVHALSTQENVEEGDIILNGKTCTFEKIFLTTEEKTIETDDGEKTGVALDDLIMKTFEGCYNCHNYNIKGEDGYQKTVDWKLMQKGILTEEGRVFFPDTPHTFWVSDVTIIEVK